MIRWTKKTFDDNRVYRVNTNGDIFASMPVKLKKGDTAAWIEREITFYSQILELATAISDYSFVYYQFRREYGSRESYIFQIKLHMEKLSLKLSLLKRLERGEDITPRRASYEELFQPDQEQREAAR
jgi:hypothetical protein